MMFFWTSAGTPTSSAPSWGRSPPGCCAWIYKPGKRHTKLFKELSTSNSALQDISITDPTIRRQTKTLMMLDINFQLFLIQFLGEKYFLSWDIFAMVVLLTFWLILLSASNCRLQDFNRRMMRIMVLCWSGRSITRPTEVHLVQMVYYSYKGEFKYYIIKFSSILVPPPLHHQSKHWLSAKDDTIKIPFLQSILSLNLFCQPDMVTDNSIMTRTYNYNIILFEILKVKVRVIHKS